SRVPRGRALVPAAAPLRRAVTAPNTVESYDDQRRKRRARRVQAFTLTDLRGLGGLCDLCVPLSCQPFNRIVNFAPPSGRFAAIAFPPCSSTRWRTIARPRPVPPGSRARDLSTR